MPIGVKDCKYGVKKEKYAKVLNIADDIISDE